MIIIAALVLTSCGQDRPYPPLAPDMRLIPGYVKAWGWALAKGEINGCISPGVDGLIKDIRRSLETAMLKNPALIRFNKSKASENVVIVQALSLEGKRVWSRAIYKPYSRIVERLNIMTAKNGSTNAGSKNLVFSKVLSEDNCFVLKVSKQK